jgi:hypothetical protein
LKITSPLCFFRLLVQCSRGSCAKKAS